MKNIYRFSKVGLYVLGLMTIFLLSACERDLNTEPIVDQTSANVFDNDGAYKQFLARLYAGFAVSGQQGPAGNPDIDGIDEGFSNYIRQYWKHQELTTDEAIIAWRDGTIHDLHNHVWTSSNEFVKAMYDRIYFQIGLTNEFLRETTDDRLSDRGVSSSLKEEIKTYRAEARFLRALSYWHALDMFGNIPFVLDSDPVGAFLPPQKDRAFVFDFLVKELTEIEGDLVGAKQNEYARADQAAAWMLLAKIYLNASVYIGQEKSAEALKVLDKVVDSGYELHGNYKELFMADNDTNGAQKEVIFPIAFDGLRTQGYGGMTFLLHAGVGGTQNPADFGINGGWFGLRTTKNLVSAFDVDVSGFNAEFTTKSSWGLVGSATTNGWNGPDMVLYEDGDQKYSAYVNLSDGEIKFRENNDWGNNYGDNDTDGSTESGGANIPVSAGAYKVTFDLGGLTYSLTKIADNRANFYTDGQELEIADPFDFSNGYLVQKYSNITSEGQPGSDASGNFGDADYPMFRLADAYLMYAEALVRSGGDLAKAATYINVVRARSFGGGGAISPSDVTLDFILAERARELHWEAHRRTDLIRFGQFTTSGIWPWKGGVAPGRTTEEFRNIFPIPSSDIISNPQLKQNSGY